MYNYDSFKREENIFFANNLITKYNIFNCKCVFIGQTNGIL